MWNFFNNLFESFKKFSLFRWMYKISWAPQAYHFSIALLGAILYRFPSRGIKVIGITGTKGKTSTLEILNAILESSGKRTALLSSIWIKIADESEENLSGNTQPGRFFIQDFLSRAKKSKCEYALLEVTSQGVLFSRHRFINWTAAVITNIAPEHVEAHGSFEAYRDAKLSFLLCAARGGASVFVNEDDNSSDYFLETLPRQNTIRYSISDIGTVPDSFSEVLPGVFNAENAAAAVAVARRLGISEDAIIKGLAEFRGVPGRMEYVQRQPFIVIVDHAHTPDSLRNAYKELRTLNSEHQTRKLICVFGSAGGGRDKWKRPEMGKIAAEYCDEIVLTNEDPWDEEPTQILADIKKGVLDLQFPTSRIREIVDRKEAIKEAIKMASDGNVVVITGKGVEPYAHLAGGVKIPWSDIECAKEGIKAKSDL